MKKECTTCKDRYSEEEFIEGDGKCSFCRRMRAARANKKAKHPNFTKTHFDDMNFVLGILVGRYDERKFSKSLVTVGRQLNPLNH